jgi:hypothetical protein
MFADIKMFDDIKFQTFGIEYSTAMFGCIIVSIGSQEHEEKKSKNIKNTTTKSADWREQVSEWLILIAKLFNVM